jgi:hypothetical protein
MDAKIGNMLLQKRVWSGISRITMTRWIWMPVLLFTVTRLGIALIAYLAFPLFLDSSSPPPYHLRPPENIVLDVLGSRWDTGFYISIVEEGYIFQGVPLPSVAFFPLLPLLMRAVTPLVGDALIAGVLVSNVALLSAVVLFYRLVDDAWGESVADRATWYLLIFPTAFFGSAIYSESLFILTAVGALYFARRSYWGVAALWGIAATMTRFVGLIVVPMLLVEWWLQWRRVDGRQRPSLRTFLSPLVAPLGLGAFMFYLWRRFDDPLAFVHGAAAWERVPQSPFVTALQLLQRPAEGWWSALMAGHIHIDNWIDFTFVIFFLSMGVVLLYKKQWAEAVFVLLGVIMPFSSGLLMSQRRYMWVLFPVYILLAQWGHRPWVDRTVTTLLLLGLALFTALFANGYWVA